MTLGRREFLQRLGAALALLGGGDCVLAGVGDRYQQALANASRCWVLLVGINTYVTSAWQAGLGADKATPLQGAVTDVALQRELLIGRFGVPAANIMTLLNEQATTGAIWHALQTHLIQQARPGDTVLFHFSGLGSQAYLTSSPNAVPLPTLVAADSVLPQPESPLVRDLFIENLAQLLGGLRGVKVLTVLDVGTAPRSSQLLGNFRVRSRPTAPVGTWQPPLEAPSLLQPPTQSPAQILKTWPGLLWWWDTADVPALEGTWNGYSAGLLTYALTHHLWQQEPDQSASYWVARVDRTLATWLGFASHLANLSPANTPATLGLPPPVPPTLPAAGYVQDWDATTKQVTLWLGGIAPEVLNCSGVALRLQPLNLETGVPSPLPVPANNPDGEAPPSSAVTLTVKNLEGLTAKAEVAGDHPLPVGTLLREVERRLPKDIPLVVALDPNLERIERVDATSALAGLSMVTSVPPGTQAVDCVLGRAVNRDRPLPPDTGSAGSAIVEPEPSDIPLSGYGLFTPGHHPLTGTPAPAGEAIKKAVTRLTPSLRTLLAIKLGRLTLNGATTTLPLALGVSGLPPTAAPLAQVSTSSLRTARIARNGVRSTLSSEATAGAPPYQIHLQAGAQPLYYLLLAVSDGDRVFVYCPKVVLPNASEAGASEAGVELSPSALQLPAQQVLTFPGLREGNLGTQPIEIWAIAALKPFEQVWKAIRTREFGQPSDRWVVLPDPLPIAKALLQDLHQAGQTTPATPDVGVVLRSHAWAGLSLRVSLPLASAS